MSNPIWLTLVITRCGCFSLDNPIIHDRRILRPHKYNCPKCEHDTDLLPIAETELPENYSRWDLKKRSFVWKIEQFNMKRLRLILSDEFFQKYNLLKLPKDKRIRQFKKELDQ